MSILQGARGVNIQGGDFKAVKGNYYEQGTRYDAYYEGDRRIDRIDQVGTLLTGNVNGGYRGTHNGPMNHVSPGTNLQHLPQAPFGINATPPSAGKQTTTKKKRPRGGDDSYFNVQDSQGYGLGGSEGVPEGTSVARPNHRAQAHSQAGVAQARAQAKAQAHARAQAEAQAQVHQAVQDLKEAMRALKKVGVHDYNVDLESEGESEGEGDEDGDEDEGEDNLGEGEEEDEGEVEPEVEVEPVKARAKAKGGRKVKVANVEGREAAPKTFDVPDPNANADTNANHNPTAAAAAATATASAFTATTSLSAVSEAPPLVASATSLGGSNPEAMLSPALSSRPGTPNSTLGLDDSSPLTPPAAVPPKTGNGKEGKHAKSASVSIWQRLHLRKDKDKKGKGAKVGGGEK